MRVEEKIDGANLGLSLAPDGALRAQNRGQYLIEPFIGQFARLPAWLALHREALTGALQPGLILFGEWCAARHSVASDALPDWFLAFDLYDREAGRFLRAARRGDWCGRLGLAQVPLLASGHLSLAALRRRLAGQHSAFGREPIEGLVRRRDHGDWLQSRAKFVRAGFTQAIDAHWRQRPIEWKRLAGVSAPGKPMAV